MKERDHAQSVGGRLGKYGQGQKTQYTFVTGVIGRRNEAQKENKAKKRTT